MSGINLWVIFGAIAVVLWQLADVFPTAMVSADTLLHALMATQAAYFGVIASTTPPFSRDELRLDPWLYSQPSSPVLSIPEDLLLLLPPSAAYVLLMTMRVDSRVLAVIKKTIERSERNTERLRHAKERLFDLIKELYS